MLQPAATSGCPDHAHVALEADAAPPPPRWRAFLLPAALLGILLAGVVAVIVLSQSVSGGNEPPDVPPFVTPAPDTVTARDVKQRDGSSLTLTYNQGDVTAEETIDVPSSAAITLLIPATASEVQVGDVVTVIGIPNEVNNFAIHSVVILPGESVPGRDGFPAAAGGFLGHEASRNANDRPLLSGLVTAIEGQSITLEGPNGPITVDLSVEAPAPLYRAAAASVDDVREGDRVAADFTTSPVTALLVLQGQ